MSLGTEREINCSSVTLLTPGTLPLLAAPLEGWVALGQAVGYKKLEWRPLNCVAERQILAHRVSAYARGGIGSAEQSFRGERTWAEASNHPNKRLAQFSYLMFPHRRDSLKNLQALQETVGDIPMTLYPVEDNVETNEQRPLKNKLVQLYPNLATMLGAKSLPELLDRVSERGWGINFDLFHYLRLEEVFTLPSIHKAIALMIGNIKEVQFSAGRTDIKTAFATTDLALRDLWQGTAESQESQLLLELVNQGYNGPIVTEVLPSTVSIYPHKLLAAHVRFTKNLKRLINQ